MLSFRQSVLEEIRRKAGCLPRSPGVYMFEDAAGCVLYVGKAKCLRSRVASYLQPSADLAATRGGEIARMIEHLVCEVQHICFPSELEAMIHESRLIRDIQPAFNIAGKTNRSSTFLEIMSGDSFPMVHITRQPLETGSTVLGPFASSRELRRALPHMQRVFKFRTCRMEIENHEENPRRKPGDVVRLFRPRSVFPDASCPDASVQPPGHPCLLHGINQCSGPCTGTISRQQYRRQIRNFERFLRGGSEQLKDHLERQMKQAVACLDFERAACLRDTLQCLSALRYRSNAHPSLPQMQLISSEGLAELGDAVGMCGKLRVIEAVTFLGQGQNIAAIICAMDGQPFKSLYRRWRLSAATPNNAFREFVARRIELASQADHVPPDAMVIELPQPVPKTMFADLASLGRRWPVLTIQSGRIIAWPGARLISLPRQSAARVGLKRILGEANRFARHYHS